MRSLAIVAALFFLCCRPGVAATTVIPFSDLGHESDLTLTGPNPRFVLFVPIYPSLRSLRIHVPLSFSPVMDPRSTVTMSVNDRVLSTSTLSELGAHPSIDRDIDVPPGTSGALQITIVGRFFEKGDICFDLDTDNFWMTVGRTGVVTAVTGNVGHDPYVRDFFRDYGGRIAVVLPADASSDLQTAALRLAYSLHQVNRWRRTTLSLGSARVPDARNVVLGDFPKALEMRGTDLYANADGVALLARELQGVLITDEVASASFQGGSDRVVREESFDRLGFPSQTLTGTGELPFLIPLQFGSLGGEPSDLHLHLALTHTPVVEGERAYVKVMVNDTLVRSFEFRGEGTQETYDVPIGADVLRASNDLRIVPTYFYRHDACRGSYPRMTTTLLGTSSFSWSALDRRTQTVGDFFNLVSGRVVVLLGAPGDAAYAFALLDAVGSATTSIREIAVQPYDGTIPSGYDYALVVAAPEKLPASGLPFEPRAQDFTLRDDAPGGSLRAQFGQPFGLLEVDSNASPALYASYWKDPAVTAGLARIPAATLAEQTGDVFLFNAERATYSSSPLSERRSDAIDPLRKALPLLLVVFAVLLALLLWLTSRRARDAS